ncbi:HAD family hydrolase [Lactovum miscens]|uniref:HAD superfamily hydrolase (TIGR01509 family) n=1 Tax=Lactovum miscens TaxID=190387 RepID=A0A841C885_9LACT|nr:HAD family phosphatase [Lactovum miscens]MBB5887938.1 HAD superfamily hydrolase (TIGR01509 family) [Lactovum miscens]
MTKIKLLIFDMDGLMFDTGRLAYRAYLQSAQMHNFQVTADVYYYLTGRTEKGIMKGMHELYGDTAPVGTWRFEINRSKDGILKKEKRVFKKKGLLQILNSAKSAGLKVALASSTSKPKIMRYLEMEEMSGMMDIIVSGQDMKQGKPAPDVFLAASRLAEIAVESCLVFEDSIVGIQAAKAAGIRSVLIEDDIRALGGFDGKHKLLKNLDNLRDKMVISDFKFDDLSQAEKYLSKKDYII